MSNYVDYDNAVELFTEVGNKRKASESMQETLLKSTVGWTGKNEFPITITSVKENNTVGSWSGNAYTLNGITYTLSEDGKGNVTEIDVDGTSTANVALILVPYKQYSGNKIISGCNGGSSTTYELLMMSSTSGDLHCYDGDVSISPQSDRNYQLRIFVRSGAVLSHQKFYPMLRDASITDDTYEPYHESVETMYEEEIHGVNLFNDGKIEVGTAWNGDTNANRARNIISCEPNSEYIVSMNGTNGLDAVFFSVSTSIPPASQTTITSFPYTIKTGASDRYITLGFNKTNITLSDVTALKVMLRKAEIEDSTYRPYNEQAIQNQLNNQTGVLGAKNLLENKATTQTVNGITYTINSDGSIIANGTATANADLIINQGFQIAEKCILSGCPANGSGSTYRLMYTSWGAPDVEYADTGYGIEINNIPIGTSPNVRVVFRVSNGQTVNNITIKPMVRLASDPDDTYVPYAMTNRELTEELTVQESAVTDIIEGATVGDLGNHLYKIGKLVWLMVRLNGVTTTAWADNTPIGMIPEGFRPRNGLRIYNSGNSNALQPIQINTVGSILSAVNLSNQTVILTATWITY